MIRCRTCRGQHDSESGHCQPQQVLAGREQVRDPRGCEHPEFATG
jgi:hypothetical protein